MFLAVIGGTFVSLGEVIDNQPTACNDGWIPCSEEFPNVGVTVLCCWKKYDRRNNTMIFYYTLMHRNEVYEWIGDLGMCTGEVTHWQPLPNLPQPYKENENERLL